MDEIQNFVGSGTVLNSFHNFNFYGENNEKTFNYIHCNVDLDLFFKQ